MDSRRCRLVFDLTHPLTPRLLVSPFKFLNLWRESYWVSVDPGVGSQRREGSSKDSPLPCISGTVLR